MDTDRDTRLVASNRKAYHDYFIDETLEAGLVLLGTEVKSLRAGRANLRDSYVEPRAGELYLIGAHISPYEQGNIANHEPLRPRKLLVHKEELGRLLAKVAEKGYTLVPTRLYFSGPHAKVEVALARGKRQYDKRVALAKKDAQREVERELRGRQKGAAD
jgi:SsrA-binding protein